MLQVNLKQHARTDMAEEQLLLNVPQEPVNKYNDFFAVQEVYYYLIRMQSLIYQFRKHSKAIAKYSIPLPSSRMKNGLRRSRFSMLLNRSTLRNVAHGQIFDTICDSANNANHVRANTIQKNAIWTAALLSNTTLPVQLNNFLSNQFESSRNISLRRSMNNRMSSLHM